jgi:hypothetical protein
MIERQRGKGFCDLVVDPGHQHFASVELLRDHLGQQRGEPRHQLARLDHDAVARRKGCHCRRQGQLQRIIPRRDDADHAERLRDQAVFGGRKLQRGGDALRRHPSLQMFGGVLDLTQHQHGLGDRGLDRAAMAEIRRDRLLEPRLILRNRRPQPLQPVEPKFERRCGLAARQLELAVKGLLQGVLPGLFAGWSMTFSRSYLAAKLRFCGVSGKGGSPTRFRTKHAPHLMRGGTGSREENASKQEGPFPDAKCLPWASQKAQKPVFGPFQSGATLIHTPSHPTASARVAFSGSLRTGSIGAIRRSLGSFRHRFSRRRATV